MNIEITQLENKLKELKIADLEQIEQGIKTIEDKYKEKFDSLKQERNNELRELKERRKEYRSLKSQIKKAQE